TAVGQAEFNIDWNPTVAANVTETGLSIHVHYDSSQLVFTGADVAFLEGYSIFQDMLEADLEDDSDPATDRVINLLWFDTAAQWPGAGIAVGDLLAAIQFETTSNFTTTTVNTRTATTSNEQLADDSATIRLVGVSSDPATQTVTVFGTDGDDVIQLNTTTKTVVFDGVVHDFSWLVAPTFNVDGAAGEDKFFVDLTSDDELVHSGPDRVPYNLTVTGASTINGNAEIISVVSKGGNDEAHLYDRATTNDVFIAKPDISYLLYDGQMDPELVEPVFQHYAREFPTVFGYATGTADGWSSNAGDIAQLYDSAANDVATAWPTAARLTDDPSEDATNRTFFSYATDFDYVNFWAFEGGVDVAELYDGTSDDVYVSRVIGRAPVGENRFQSYMRDIANTEFFNVANLFERTNSHAVNGGNDQAQFYDTFADDTFVVSQPTDAYMHIDGSIFSRALSFESTAAYKKRGGTDTAQFYDSSGDDQFTANATSSTLHNALITPAQPNGYTHSQYGLDSVLAIARVHDDEDVLNNLVPTNYAFSNVGDWETVNRGAARGPVAGRGSSGSSAVVDSGVTDVASAVTDSHLSLDADGDGKIEPLTDGVIFLRRMAGFGQIPVSSGIVDSSIVLDVDGDGKVLPLTDGMLIVRYLAGFRGESLINGVVSSSGSRTGAASIEAWLSPYIAMTYRPENRESENGSSTMDVALTQIDTSEEADTIYSVEGTSEDFVITVADSKSHQ
ncbi:hypothetical protein OAH18_03790, partial [bacterium]|nr:hypothetical protein [bacterium]